MLGPAFQSAMQTSSAGQPRKPLQPPLISERAASASGSRTASVASRTQPLECASQSANISSASLYCDTAIVIAASKEDSMQSNRRIFRLPYRFALLLSSLALASIASVRAEEAELSQMSKNEIRSLQQRLADSGCFNGTADGIGSDALDAARVRCPSQTPSLRIETGAHVGPIWRITADASCHLVATASEDKTLRTWSMPNGKTDQVVRLPIGDGDEGKLYATALSPNGRWLAVGGHEARFETTSWLAVGGHEARFETTNRGSTQSITLIDLARDKRTRLGSFDDDINEIAFSSNNERLAVGYAHGLQVFDIAGEKSVRR